MSQQNLSWQHLNTLSAEADTIKLSDLMKDEDRVESYSLSIPGLHLDYSRHLMTDEIMEALLLLAANADISGRASAMTSGEIINASEHRQALHMAEREASDDLPEDVLAHLAREKEQLESISHAVRSGQWTGVTGERITDVINIGIGGSDLGPKMVCEALREFTNGPECHFISNVDGAEILSLLRDLDAGTTLLIISSKTFTTAETLRNAHTALDWLKRELEIDNPAASPHVLAVTANASEAGKLGIPENQILTILETIGGRYSLWSAMGLSICIAAGYEEFEAFRRGGATMDRHFMAAPLEKNMPVILAVLGIWYNNFLKVQNHAVIPYCERLGLFVSYLQQLDMESNGKSVTQSGTHVDDATGPVIWGQTGTNGQHAFFQLLHQGTQWTPIDFIGVTEDKLSDPEHHRMLLANMIAQGEALMLGNQDKTLEKSSPGNRPSSTLLLDELTPETLGMLVALYEHKVFAQAIIWDINPFDQWGVELGKQLTNRILGGKGDHDPSTLDLMKRTGLSQ